MTHNETMPAVQLMQIPVAPVCRHCRIQDKETGQDWLPPAPVRHGR